jgi:CRP/FNR family cyclic AMP-dependent transcriptional regulator
MLNSSQSYLASKEHGAGRNIVRFKTKQALFTQGNPADSIFYLQSGRAKVTVVSEKGKEATVAVLTEGDFVGEEALAPEPGLRVATATALTPCTVLKLNRDAILGLFHEEKGFSTLFLAFLLRRSMRTQADLVDHLFNCSEKRLARVLLLMADAGEQTEQEILLPEITQESLAAMIGTTRSRVSFFMNRFREQGFIEYDSRIRVHKSLLNVVQHDQLHPS